MHQAARTIRKARKMRKKTDRKAKENIFKVGDMVVYKNHHRTELVKKWYAYYRIVRKHGDLTFTN